ncbi:MAG: hypothetical protein LBS31_03855 [Candidatus Adiutrix sp.]|jgi:hypothetical protein|nr:hypothetical protein [Candidatus Adiutrix sp.]
MKRKITSQAAWALPLVFAALYVLWLAAMASALLNLYPAALAGDPAALAAALALGPMAVAAAQGLFYLPRRAVRPVMFLQGRPVDQPLAWLPLPARRRLSAGPALAATADKAVRETLGHEAAARLYGASALPRLALLLEGRSPLELLLRRLARPGGFAGLRLPALLFWLVTAPARQLLRLSGYIFVLAWSAWDDPGPVSELMDHKRRLAFDLARRAESAAPGFPALGLAEAEVFLGALMAGLRRVYNDPGYGREEAGPAADEDGAAGSGEAFFTAPCLAPRYCGVYLDMPATLEARTAADMYDFGAGPEDAELYPPELGQAAEEAALLQAERDRLEAVLAEEGAEGVINLDGRPVFAWNLVRTVMDLDDERRALVRRVAGHHRRCRSVRLAAAARLGRNWPEYLRSLGGLLHFAEHGRRALSEAAAAFSEARRDALEAAGVFYQTLRDLAGPLAGLAPELAAAVSYAAPEREFRLLPPSPGNLSAWLEAQEEAAAELAEELETLRSRALNALAAAEAEVEELYAALKEGRPVSGEAPEVPAAPFAPAAPGRRPAAAVRVYSAAGQLRVGWGRSLLSALLMALVIWQAHSLGRARFSAHLFNHLVSPALGVEEGQFAFGLGSGAQGGDGPPVLVGQGQAAFLAVAPEGEAVMAPFIQHDHSGRAAVAQAQHGAVAPFVVGQPEGGAAFAGEGHLNLGRAFLVAQPDVRFAGGAEAHLQAIFTGVVQHEEARLAARQGQEQAGAPAFIGQAQFSGHQRPGRVGGGRRGRGQPDAGQPSGDSAEKRQYKQNGYFSGHGLLLRRYLLYYPRLKISASIGIISLWAGDLKTASRPKHF